ncbi:MAG: LPS-assembly protein LptD [Gammaproteobacteria bacterium]|nr:LPS-assembly protein LptD [Gammaproteobacteria bacterium]
MDKFQSNIEHISKEDQLLFTAKQITIENADEFHLAGDLTIEGEGRRIHADNGLYQRHSGELQLNGHIRYLSEPFTLTSERASLSLSANSGNFTTARFYFPTLAASGSAASLAFSPTTATLSQVSFTTCPGENPDWQLNAPKMQLNQAENLGEAYHLFFAIKGVPLIYLPYINFPLEGRKSGLLPVSYHHSDRNGSDLQIPLYWNIAPQQDATYTPRFLAKRGVMQQLEWRGLGNYQRGEIAYSHLADDPLNELGSRSFTHLSHRLELSNGIYSHLRYQRLSDAEWLTDFDSEYIDSDADEAPRILQAGLRQQHLQLRATVSQPQALSSTLTYQRLPTLSLAWQPPTHLALKPTLRSEWSRFRHRDEAMIKGERTTLRPAVALPYHKSSGFFRPELALHHSHYQLSQTAAEIYASKPLNIPILSIDSGLFFERDLTLRGDAGWHQTLDPRLYLLYIPYEDQSLRPNFDSNRIPLSWDRLFSPDRFSGSDRLGDSQQANFALSSQFFDPSGSERLQIGIGRIHFFNSPKVTLNGLWHEDLDSATLLRTRLTPNRQLELRHQQQIADNGDSLALEVGVRYQLNPRSELRLTHYDEQQSNAVNDTTAPLQQSDILANLRLSPRWQIVGLWQYDHYYQRQSDLILGGEYRSCCWSLRTLLRRQWHEESNRYDESFYLSLALTGLAPFSNRLEDELERGILNTSTSP